MLVHLKLYACDHPGCDATSPISERTVGHARALAEGDGWLLSIRHGIEHALCPMHRPQFGPPARDWSIVTRTHQEATR